MLCVMFLQSNSYVDKGPRKTQEFVCPYNPRSTTPSLLLASLSLRCASSPLPGSANKVLLEPILQDIAKRLQQRVELPSPSLEC